MKNVQELWKTRVTEYSTELRKYLRYMFNDHLLFVLIFALGGGAFTYNQWVDTLQPNFPAPFIMAVILMFVLTISPVYTFLREADGVFLLPLESRMTGYFHKGIWVSFLFQSYLLVLVLAALMPMYVKVTNAEFNDFFILLAVLLLMKIWNLYVRWYLLKYQEREAHRIDFLIRLVINGVFLYFLFQEGLYTFLLIIGILMVLYGLYFYGVTKKKTLKWDLLISLEEQRMLAFYRIANMFTDVPKLKGRVSRRKWLDILINLIPYRQDQTYKFLYIRALLRTSEYFGLFSRLTIISLVMISFSDSLVLHVFIALLFMYLTGFQVLPMYKRFDFKLWVLIYPVSKEIRASSFQWVVTRCLLFQAIVFSLPIFIKGMWLEGVITLLAGLSFSLAFSQFYMPKRLKKLEERYV